MYEYICTLCDLSSPQKEQETVVIYQRQHGSCRRAGQRRKQK